MILFWKLLSPGQQSGGSDFVVMCASVLARKNVLPFNLHVI